MDDPTYEQDRIDANPIWQLAWTIGQILDDEAPIGWYKHIGLARCLLDNYEIKPKAK